jgi:hypothetical protein
MTPRAFAPLILLFAVSCDAIDDTPVESSYAIEQATELDPRFHDLTGEDMTAARSAVLTLTDGSDNGYELSERQRAAFAGLDLTKEQTALLVRHLLEVSDMGIARVGDSYVFGGPWTLYGCGCAIKSGHNPPGYVPSGYGYIQVSPWGQRNLTTRLAKQAYVANQGWIDTAGLSLERDDYHKQLGSSEMIATDAIAALGQRALPELLAQGQSDRRYDVLIILDDFAENVFTPAQRNEYERLHTLQRAAAAAYRRGLQTPESQN